VDEKAKAAEAFLKGLASRLNPEPVAAPPAAPAPQPAPVKVAKTPKLTVETLETLIVNLYLIRGKDSSVYELAAHAGVSESTVRKVLDSCGGAPDGTRGEQTGVGNRRTWVYGPTRGELRALLIAKGG
jgi:hypothetical protein